MDATVGLLEVQGDAGAGVPVADKELVCPTHSGIFPEMLGIGFTVMVSEELHPARFVYVMFVVPTLIPVIRPEFEIVATLKLLEIHGLFEAAVPFPLS